MLAGWLFDAYAKNDKMVFWLRQSNGDTIRLEDKWSHPIYVAADDKSLFRNILQNEDISRFLSSSSFVSKYEKLADSQESTLLQLRLKDSNRAKKVASNIEKKFRFGQIRLYNVDVLPAQTYFYEHGIFPTCYCQVDNSKSTLDWTVKDDVWSTDYQLPQFEKVHLRVFPKTDKGRIAKSTDMIEHIEIQKYLTGEVIRIEGESEIDIFFNLIKVVANINPDFVLTDDGDSFTFPYLIERANYNGIQLELGREKDGGLIKPVKVGTSYFSYGKIFFKPSTVKLPGRIHIDTDNSFIMGESGLPGLYELARVCRMPFHTASRASIGKCMSSLQFYTAYRKNVLIPWKPTLAEHVKSLEELLIADRGGMILEPRIGVHENVAELDFVSLYPSIMEKKNISAETVFCKCCPDSKLGVPGLDNYYRCEKRRGLVPIALEILLAKRKIYKQLRNSATDTKLREMYDARQTAIKWVLVTSFGYLGFNNAKFGRIDAHIAVCAFDRQILINTIRTAEQQGFKILHAIVDSIWVQKKDGQKNASAADDYETLKGAIETETNFDISLEGLYKWVAFVPSKSNDIVGVPNRYFGVFEDGSLKLRGIEARRHDTPIFFSDYQQLVLNMLSEADTIGEVKAMFPKIMEIFQTHLKLLKERRVNLNILAFAKRISKNYDEYQDRNTVENNAILNLSGGGKSLRAGEILKYVIIDYYRKNSKKRSVPIELANSQTRYDIKRYCEVLEEVTNTVTQPFGLSIKNENTIEF